MKPSEQKKGKQPFTNKNKNIVDKIRKGHARTFDFDLFKASAVTSLIIGIIAFLLIGLFYQKGYLLIGILLLLTGLTLFTHNDRISLLNRILPLLLNGLIFIIIGVSDMTFVMYLSVLTPLFFLINNLSKKYFVILFIPLTGLLVYTLYETENVLFLCLYLILLYYSYYKTRRITHPKATMYNEPTAYELRKLREKKQENYWE